MTAGFERCRIDLGHQRQCDDRTNARDGGQTCADRAGLVRGVQFDIDFFDAGADLFDLLTQQGKHLFGFWRNDGLLFNSR